MDLLLNTFQSDFLTFSPEKLTLLVVFGVVVVLFFIVDLGILHRKNKEMSFREAFWMSVFWIAISLLFGVVVYYYIGSQAAYEYFLAYVVEKTLSVDNIFIFLIILQFFNIPQIYYHKILFFGIIGAIFFRLLFLTVGLVLISYFYWIIYVFGAILIYTGIKLLRANLEEQFNPTDSWIYKFMTNKLRYRHVPDKGNFFVNEHGKVYFTTIFLALVMIEVTDIFFAIDSIPAVLAISQDPFIVYTSNIFAILGLRAMFFLLASSVKKFPYIQQGLAFILMYIGSKMMLEMFSFHIHAGASLLIVLLVLAGSVIASMLDRK